MFYIPYALAVAQQTAPNRVFFLLKPQDHMRRVWLYAVFCCLSFNYLFRISLTVLSDSIFFFTVVAKETPGKRASACASGFFCAFIFFTPPYPKAQAHSKRRFGTTAGTAALPAAGCMGERALFARGSLEDENNAPRNHEPLYFSNRPQPLTSPLNAAAPLNMLRMYATSETPQRRTSPLNAAAP